MTVVDSVFHPQVSLTPPCYECAAACSSTACQHGYSGVQNVDTNVENKTVIVQADESVDPQAMLAKLQKWSEASGKSVALAS